jgi:hypothetical protein
MSAPRDQILDMWAAGATSNAIAAALGVSRNSVIGFVHRARAAGDARAKGRGGIPAMGARKPTAPKPLATTPAMSAADVIRQEERREAARRAAAYVEPRQVEAVQQQRPVARPVHHRTCQWVTAYPTTCGAVMCGAPSVGASWCREHYRRVYQRAQATEAAA